MERVTRGLGDGRIRIRIRSVRWLHGTCRLCEQSRLPPLQAAAAQGPTLYQQLGLEPSASPAEVKSAYYSKCKEFHPDSNQAGLSPAEAQQMFSSINNAYSVLADGSLRSQYDERLAQSRVPLSQSLQRPFATHPTWKGPWQSEWQNRQSDFPGARPHFSHFDEQLRRAQAAFPPNTRHSQRTVTYHPQFSFRSH